MKFIKKELEKLNKNYIKFYNNFKITNILILIFTLYAMIFNFEDYIFICYALLIMLPMVFYAEYTHKRLMYVIGLIVGVISAILMSGEPPIQLSMIYAGLVIMLCTLDVYMIIRREKDLSKYLCKLFESLLQIYIIFTIISIGLLMLFLLTDYMIFNDKLTEYFYVVYYLCIGVYLVPSIILSLVYNDNKVTVLSDVLISKVLMILMNIYFVIVLLYTFKGLFTLKYSIYSVYMIIGCLFLMFLPLSIMAENYKGKYYEFNSKWLKYVFIIPLILQIYVLINQIHSYGFTVTRYIGLMFVVFEMLSLVLLIYKEKKYIVDTLLVFCTLVFITLIIPGCNVRDTVIASQVNRLMDIYPEGITYKALSNSDRKRVKNIYEYISNMDSKAKYEIPDYLDKDKILAYEDSVDEYGVFAAVNDDTRVNITNYKYLEEITVDGKNMLKIKDTNYDFRSYGKYAAVHNDEDFNKFVNEHALIHLSDKYDFYIKYINGTVDNEDFIFDQIEGYLLYK